MKFRCFKKNRKRKTAPVHVRVHTCTHTHARTQSRHRCEGDAWKRLMNPVVTAVLRSRIIRNRQFLTFFALSLSLISLIPDSEWSPSSMLLRISRPCVFVPIFTATPCLKVSARPTWTVNRTVSGLPVPVLPPSFILFVQNPDPLGPAHGPLKGQGDWGCRGPAPPSLGPGSCLPACLWDCGPSWHCALATLSTRCCLMSWSTGAMLGIHTC